MKKYNITINTYTKTSKEENYKNHIQICQDFLKHLHKNKILEKKTTKQ